MKTYFRFEGKRFVIYVLASVLLSLAMATLLDFWAGDIGLWLVLVLLGTAAGFFGSLESARPSLAISKKLVPAILVKMGRLAGTSLVLLVTGLVIFVVHLDIWDSFWLPAFMFWMIAFQAVHLGIARWGKDKPEATSLAMALYVLLFIELAGFGIGVLDVASQLFAKTRPLFPMPKVPVPALLAIFPPAFFAVVGLLQVVGYKTGSRAAPNVAESEHVVEQASDGGWQQLPMRATWLYPADASPDLAGKAWPLESSDSAKYLGEFGIGAIVEDQVARGIEIWLFDKAEVHTVSLILTTHAHAAAFEATGKYESVLIVGEEVEGQLASQSLGIAFSLDNLTLSHDGSIESLEVTLTSWQKAT